MSTTPVRTENPSSTKAWTAATPSSPDTLPGNVGYTEDKFPRAFNDWQTCTEKDDPNGLAFSSAYWPTIGHTVGLKRRAKVRYDEVIDKFRLLPGENTWSRPTSEADQILPTELILGLGQDTLFWCKDLSRYQEDYMKTPEELRESHPKLYEHLKALPGSGMHANLNSLALSGLGLYSDKHKLSGIPFEVTEIWSLSNLKAPLRMMDLTEYVRSRHEDRKLMEALEQQWRDGHRDNTTVLKTGLGFKHELVGGDESDGTEAENSEDEGSGMRSGDEGGEEEGSEDAESEASGSTEADSEDVDKSAKSEGGAVLT